MLSIESLIHAILPSAIGDLEAHRVTKERRMNAENSPILDSSAGAVSDGSSQADSIRFDRYVLDLRRGTLRSGQFDIEIRPKTFKVLKFLAENAGRLVSKDEIAAAVWPDVTVTDDSLVQCIKELRRALGQDGARLVKTVPRRGYRLEAHTLRDGGAIEPDLTEQLANPLERADDGPPPSSWTASAPWRLVAGITSGIFALALITFWLVGHSNTGGATRSLGRPAIAVLPFASFGGDYFADGMTEDIINALGRFSSLTVISRNAVAPYKGKAVTPAQIGSDLSVHYVLEGSVRRFGDQLRVTAELTETDRGQVLWSGRYDEPLSSVFAVQDRITAQVVGALAIKVTQVEQQRAFVKPAENLEAYDYVLRARQAFSEAKRSTNVEARALLQRAIELDPSYAAAYTGLGESYRLSVTMGWTQSADWALKEATALAYKAVSLNDADVRAHVLLGQIHVYYGRYEQALTELDRAIAVNPNDADAIAGRGTVLVWSSRTKEGIAALEMAQRVDPRLNVFNRFALALAYYLTEKYDIAVELLSRNLTETPSAAYNAAVLAACYAQLGRREDAAAAVAVVQRLDPAFDAEAFGTQLQKVSDRKRLHEGLRKAGF
jgi:adenylate cyclase